ncbi:membrane protein [Sinomonas humi]|uniref:Membrane protein n=2 Tax=Sinomonas humi TaxID=1338436 RepID=A0A0B2AM64_9MICC|nr:membrane protein [Sinomonas humi]
MWAMVALGIVAAILTGLFSSWWHAAAAGWGAAALLYDIWVLSRILPMDAEQTKNHAREEDPRRGTRDFLILSANVAAIVAVIMVMVSGNQDKGAGKVTLALLAILVVAASWLLLHTIFILRYAELYYSTTQPGGVEFNQDEPPKYSDFAYLGFTLGMTFQVSDTNLTTTQIRTEALKQGILGYVFSTVILAATINLVIGLATQSG